MNMTNCISRGGPVWHPDNDGGLWAWIDGCTVYVDNPDEYIQRRQNAGEAGR